MRYLITTKNNAPFFTDWFDSENHFNSTLEMIVYDLYMYKYTIDGKNWTKIEIDNL